MRNELRNAKLRKLIASQIEARKKFGYRIDGGVPGCARMAAAASNRWRVVRWSGRGCDPERELPHAAGEAAARAAYAREQIRLRQGYVRLLRPDGTVEQERVGPMLRDRGW